MTTNVMEVERAVKCSSDSPPFLVSYKECLIYCYSGTHKNLTCWQPHTYMYWFSWLVLELTTANALNSKAYIWTLFLHYTTSLCHKHFFATCMAQKNIKWQLTSFLGTSLFGKKVQWLARPLIPHYIKTPFDERLELCNSSFFMSRKET